MLCVNGYYFPIKKTTTVEPMQDVATAAEMDALLIAANLGKAYRYIGTTTEVYTNGDIYIVEEGD